MYLKKIVITAILIAALVAGAKYFVRSGKSDKFMDSHSDWEIVPKIQFYISQIDILFSDYGPAIERLRKMQIKYAETPWAAKTQYSIAKAYDDMGNIGMAVNEYNKLMTYYPKSEYYEKARIRVQYLR